MKPCRLSNFDLCIRIVSSHIFYLATQCGDRRHYANCGFLSWGLICLSMIHYIISLCIIEYVIVYVKVEEGKESL